MTRFMNVLSKKARAKEIEGSTWRDGDATRGF